VAAIFCTIGALVVTIAALLSEPNSGDLLAAIGAAIGTLGGVAWIISAMIGLRQR
jgi:hypothetical protein